MPIVSRKQYAELCGDDILKINKWIQRGKISVSAVNKKLIDTENAINATFMADRRRFNGIESFNGIVHENSIIDTKISKSVTKSAKKVTKTPKNSINIPKDNTKSLPKEQKRSPGRPPKPPLKQTERRHKIVPTAEPKEIKQFDKRIAEQSARDERRVDQDMQKKQQDIELQALKIQSEKIRLDKTAGNLLPIDLGLGVIERHANSILKTFEKGFERIADIYSNLAGFDPVLRSDFMRECREELASCVTNAGEMAQEEIEILVGNYAETLMVGQRLA